jgi:DNA-binding XRE family transcriptional regulator
MSLATAGEYIKELREKRKLSQTKLGEALDVSRSTVERLEVGEPNVGIATVLRAIEVLNASPWHYYDVAMHTSVAYEEVCRRQAILSGIHTYVRALCEQKQIGIDVLSDVMQVPRATLTRWFSDPAAQVSEMALLLALVYLDVPLTDIANIVHATTNHEALGRRLAENRAHAMQAQQMEHMPRTVSRNVPALEAISRRLVFILHNGQELSPIQHP